MPGQVSICKLLLWRFVTCKMEVRERKQPEQESLKEKLRVKWNTRDFTPQEDHSNVMSMNLFFFMAVTLLFEALYYLVPRLYPDSPWFMRGVAICLFIETLINWHRSYFDTANYVKPETKEKFFPDSQDTPIDWTACIKCQVNTASFHLVVTNCIYYLFHTFCI